MKKATLTVSFDCEKLDALTFHMGKKDADLQTELEDTVQKLYEKHVRRPPVNTLMTNCLVKLLPNPSPKDRCALPL